MSNLFTRLFLLLQKLLPQHGLSRLAGKLANSENSLVRKLFISIFCRAFDVDLSEAERESPGDYKHFNDFFTRSLKPAARPIDSDSSLVVSPADGTVSQAGTIEQHLLLQAKNHFYSLDDLLAGDSVLANRFCSGSFAAIYLSPRDYHRVHMPIEGRLVKTIYVPGKLFSVNAATTEHLPGLFANNERLICLFETEVGLVAQILVGAMIVAAIDTVWTKRPSPTPGYPVIDEEHQGLKLKKGVEMGRFSLGSTVILLFENNAVALNRNLLPGVKLRMGSNIATVIPAR